jgi:dihydrofolate reductase
MITYYAACSLDNYLAGPNGELDWLPQPDGGEDFGYKAFYDRQDLMVMGRKTYDICLGFGDWPYAGKETIVLTRQSGRTPKFNERFEAFDAALWRERSKTTQIYLNGGGEAAKLFLQHGLIDRLELAIVPVTLGAGLPLFAAGAPKTAWKLESSQAAAMGLIQNVYNRV